MTKAWKVPKVLCNKAKTQSMIDRKTNKCSVTLCMSQQMKHGRAVKCFHVTYVIWQWLHEETPSNTRADLEEHVAGGQRLSRVSWRRLRGRRRGREAETVVQDWTILHSSAWPRLLLLLVILQEARLQTGVAQNGIRFIDHVVSWTGVVVVTFPRRLNPPRGTENKNIKLHWWKQARLVE